MFGNAFEKCEERACQGDGKKLLSITNVDPNQVASFLFPASDHPTPHFSGETFSDFRKVRIGRTAAAARDRQVNQPQYRNIA
ncbi:hypothetical protein [Sinorhizobium sp. RAC02]|uniref:hypothetical protein n=1 Tax=Sinorhizobium sp. RAC02 TaxID=1842534 RepID=UPI002570E3AE|nr:hypothetical protein [Sinorhizobium sp. RAC02]